MHKTAIVIGATGLIGKALVTELCDAKHIARIIVITRKTVHYESEKVQNHVIDFADLNRHADLFKGDILFSCLGTTLKQAGSIMAQRVVDLDYQYMAATLALQQGVGHYLLVSSSGANQHSLSAYLKMKGELENKIAALNFRHISILQPSLLLGTRKEKRFAEGLASNVLPLLCTIAGLTRYRPIYGWQVAKKMVAISKQPNQRFERIRLDEIFSN